PQYRLPEAVLNQEIAGVTKLGVDIRLNQALGRDFSLDDLFDRNYKAVFLGLGAQAGSSMRCENEDAEGVLSGIDFLEDVKLKKIKSINGKVAVIGGGNTAMDAARSALRLGAEEVTIVYRRTRKEMPANEMEIDEAEEEGIRFEFLTAPVKVVPDENGRATGIECIKMELGPPDDSGRRRPVPVEGSNFFMPMDWIIAAIGQKADLEFAAKDSKLVNVKKSRWGTLQIKPEIMETNIPGVFSGGDVVLGPATAIEAIADGRKAAQAIHKYITGEKLEIPKKPFISRRDNFKKLSAQDFQDQPKTVRAKMPVRDPKERSKDWEEIELGFSREQVYQEAIRCLECGCQAFYDCDLQRHSTEYEAIQDKYHGNFHDVEPDRSHPFIQIELNKCILCGRCVRICDEVMGLGVYGFVQRGYDAKVKPLLEMPLAETHCISCGQCVETCPTGAIIDKPDTLKPGPWTLEQYKTICQYCSVGCSLQADVLEDRVIKISADPEAAVNEYGNLCIKGRYGFRFINDENRLTQPLIRRNGELEPVGWEEALNYAATRITELQQKEEEWMVLGSPHASNEENYLLQKFARTVLGTQNVGSLSNLSEMPEPLLRASMSNTTFKGIDDSDFVMVCNFDPIETHPVLYIQLQKAARSGKTVFMGCCPDSRLAKKSNSLAVPDNAKVPFLQYVIDMIHSSGIYDRMVQGNGHPKFNQVFSQVSGMSGKMKPADFGFSEKEFRSFFKKLTSAKKPLFICNRENASPELIHWLNSLGFVLGQSEAFLSLPAAANYQGMLDMGMLPDYYPGYQRVDNEQVAGRFSRNWDKEMPRESGIAAEQALSRFRSGEIKGAILWGQDPAGAAELDFQKKDEQFLMVADMFMTETARLADVVFPLIPFFEMSGTVTNAEARVQAFSAVTRPLTGRPNWQLLVELSTRLNYRMKYHSVEEITAEILDTVPEYKKGVAVFRNGYVPQPGVLKEAVKTHVRHNGSSLEKWWADYLKKAKMPVPPDLPESALTLQTDK
ncbi:MAG: molybdopterin-dependent oxidoreductase, partial [Calditrichia bacterium]